MSLCPTVFSQTSSPGFPDADFGRAKVCIRRRPKDHTKNGGYEAGYNAWYNKGSSDGQKAGYSVGSNAGQKMGYEKGAADTRDTNALAMTSWAMSDDGKKARQLYERGLIDPIMCSTKQVTLPRY
ncbi:hypothetical protein AD951_02500 [Acetobacter malorum]|uniref:Uncharacterized protein n=1 Tax=Acetobacter malorum TaxID=178901 RepID=A0A149USC0_9PROT|nr:hypothetical protein [Acetobacter malorum]KXV70636.1 hypothetical protein AD951_02500 [Acetobacter malorum]